MSVFSHREFDNHQQVAFFNDKKSGLRAIIAVHNTNLGPALGGCRMWPYGSDEEALTDVLRLSKGMTYKSALANLQLGGGKAVIIGDSRTQKTDDLLYAMGDFIEGLGGRYITAEDSGTSVTDILKMGQRTEHVSGVDKASDHGGDPSPTTARSVFVSLREAVLHKLGRSDLKGLKVAIQGLGNVGYRLARYLHEAVQPSMSPTLLRSMLIARCASWVLLRCQEKIFLDWTSTFLRPVLLAPQLTTTQSTN